MRNFSSVNRVKLFTYKVMNTWKSYMRTAWWRIIWKKIIAVILRNFCSWEKKAFCSCVYNCDDLLSYNCLCIVCINVETMTDIFLVVALKVPWPFAVQNQEFPFYDNLYSLQNRKKKHVHQTSFVSGETQAESKLNRLSQQPILSISFLMYLH